MMEKVEDIIEHLKKIQAEQIEARKRDAEILSRLASLEHIIYSDTCQKVN